MTDRESRVPAALREEYSGEPLDEATVARDPFEQFGRWFDAAVAAGIRLANAMTLATVSPGGQPSARVVLLKSWDERGLVFYTSYRSRKAEDMATTPRVALLSWWCELERQVRVEGRVEKVAARESDAYFATRPRASNLSAMASPQSRTVPDRAWLGQRVRELAIEWSDRELVRPEDWGGYRVVPDRFEFWQGRPDRLHDRIVYSYVDNEGGDDDERDHGQDHEPGGVTVGTARSWYIRRLAP